MKSRRELNVFLVVVLSSLVLTGCGSTTVVLKRDFPELPPTLVEKAKEDLKPLDSSNPKLSTLVENSIMNMAEYHKLLERYKAFQEWYTTQKKIFDEAEKNY